MNVIQKITLLCLACTLYIGAGKVYAQKEANTWYFGDGLVWNFPEAKPKVSPQSKLNTSLVRASFTMSDSLGNLQFYTDGISVWNAKHEVIAQNLHGETAIVATPYPQKNGFYYLFHVGTQEDHKSFPRAENDSLCYAQDVNPNTTSVFMLYYTLLDIKNNKVIAQNQLMAKDVISDICVARHAKKGCFWLVAHQNNAKTFMAYPITQAGLDHDNASLSFIGREYKTAKSPTWNYHVLKSNLQGTKLLVDNMEFDKIFEVFDFDNREGNVYESKNMLFPDNALPIGYEFSPNEKYVYAFRVGKHSQKINNAHIIVQFDLESNKLPVNVYIALEKHNVMDARSYAQLAPDNKIYVNARNPYTITNVNEVLTEKNILTNSGHDKLHRMPNIAHLLPMPISIEKKAIEVGKPFTRPILFETNQATLKPEHETELKDILAYLLQNPKTTIEIAGHTDNEGEESKNKTLSEARAQALANFLITKGVGKERIKAVGYGSAKPIAENTTPAGKAKNRRIEFLIK